MLNINKEKFEVSFNGTNIHLTKNEFFCLYFLTKNVNKIVTRDFLIINVWDDAFRTERVVDVCLSKIRSKLKIVGCDIEIATKIGVGYKIIKNSTEIIIDEPQNCPPKEENFDLKIGSSYKNKRNEIATILNFSEFNEQKIVIYILINEWKCSKISDFRKNFDIKIS
jgi:DNA-binding winged helix-turn-helix (wHTH) protein